MHKKPKPPPKSFDAVEYQCAACEFASKTAPEFIAHVQTHGYTEQQAKGAKVQMQMHLDIRTHHVTTYQITIEGKRVGAKLASCGRRQPWGG